MILIQTVHLQMHALAKKLLRANGSMQKQHDVRHA